MNLTAKLLGYDGLARTLPKAMQVTHNFSELLLVHTLSDLEGFNL